MAVAEAVRKSIRNTVCDGVEAPDPYTSEQFASLAAAYPEIQMELTKEGELIFMPPTMTKSGMRNFKLTVRFGEWSEANGLGIGFDSSTIFTFPNGAKRSPDLSWVEASRWEALTEEEQESFSRICPDFVAELRSKTDRLSTLQKKMREYIANGARLGWLIDPKSNRVEIYRPGQEVEILDAPVSISGDPVLPGFTLDLKDILS
jgi:Uma2 family endonuclease